MYHELSLFTSTGKYVGTDVQPFSGLGMVILNN